MRPLSRTREWHAPGLRARAGAYPWRDAQAAGGAMPLRLVSPALPRAQDQPRANRSFENASGLRARAPTSSARRRIADRAPARARTDELPARRNHEIAASIMPPAPEKCSPAHWDDRLAGWPPHRSAQG